MKKILVTGLSANIGGIETFFMSYYRLLKGGYQFDFVTVEGSIAFEDEILENRGQVFKLPSFKRNPIAYSLALNRIMKENNYDILHANMLSAANILPLKLAKKNHIRKIIAHSHNSDVPSGVVRKILNARNRNKLPQYANSFFACSVLAGNWFFGNRCRFRVLQNAIDIEKFSFSKSLREKMREELGIKDQILIGHVGRICEQKNQLFLVDVFEKLLKVENNCKLILIGDGENSELSTHLNNPHIIKLPVQKNINEYYNAFDLFVLPSLFEGLPVVGLEAQANGLPCLFADTISAELKCNANCQFIPLISETWVKKIKTLVDEKKLTRAENILLREKGFSIAEAQAELRRIYDE